MAKIATNISIDEDIKPKAQELLAEFGLDLSTAVNMFLRQMVREKAIPFEIRKDVPNATTLAAIEEVEDMEKHPELSRTYTSVDDLMNDLWYLLGLIIREDSCDNEQDARFLLIKINIS